MIHMESKLSGEFKNTSGDTSLVPCSVSGGLNKEETLSAYCIVLTDNLGEENRLLFKEEDWT